PRGSPYVFDVSKNVTPASKAASTTARVPETSTRRPKLLQPSPTTDTSGPSVPRERVARSEDIKRSIAERLNRPAEPPASAAPCGRACPPRSAESRRRCALPAGTCSRLSAPDPRRPAPRVTPHPVSPTPQTRRPPRRGGRPGVRPRRQLQQRDARAARPPRRAD